MPSWIIRKVEYKEIVEEANENQSWHNGDKMKILENVTAVSLFFFMNILIGLIIPVKTETVW